MNSKLKVGLIFLIIIAVSIIFFKVVLSQPSVCLRSPDITDIQIRPIDKNSIRITWKTDRETYSVAEIKEQDKVNDILRKSFSCNFSGNLNLEGLSHQDIFKKYNCSFSNENGELSLKHNNYLYGYCTTTNFGNNSPYLGCIVKPADEQNSTYHSVVFDILQPGTEYAFDINAENSCGINSIETVRFRMPENI
jgi:hypothetical protein